MTTSDNKSQFEIKNKLFKKLTPKWTQHIESGEAFDLKHESELAHPNFCVIGEIWGGDSAYYGQRGFGGCEYCHNWSLLSFAVVHDSTNEQMNKDIDRLMRHVKSKHKELIK